MLFYCLSVKLKPKSPLQERTYANYVCARPTGLTASRLYALLGAMYSCSLQTFSRSQGASATAAAAYRSGGKIHCERTGITHDYTRKAGVIQSEVMGIKSDSATLWNLAESAENRKNSVVAREIRVSLPHESSDKERVQAMREMSRWLINNYGVAVEWALHDANRSGDARNIHGHILFTTRSVEPDGSLGAKTRILDESKNVYKDKTRPELGVVRAGGSVETERMREKWAAICQPIAKSKSAWSHLSHAKRGIKRAPTKHLGAAATAVERKTGSKSQVRQRFERAMTRIELAHEMAIQNEDIDWGLRINKLATPIPKPIPPKFEAVKPPPPVKPLFFQFWLGDQYAKQLKKYKLATRRFAWSEQDHAQDMNAYESAYEKWMVAEAERKSALEQAQKAAKACKYAASEIRTQRGLAVDGRTVEPAKQVEPPAPDRSRGRKL